jgi:hypothetical protein
MRWWLLVVAMAACFSKPGLRERDGGGSGEDDASPIDSPPIDTTGDVQPIPMKACAAIYTNDLVAYYDFEDPIASLADDGVAAELEGVVENAMLTSGRTSPQALNFQPAGAVVQVPSSPPVTDLPQITVCTWLRLAVQPTAVSAIVVDKSQDGTADGWNAYLNTDETPPMSFIAFYTPYGAYKLGETPIPIATAWTHACMTWDGTPGSAGIRIYRNGGSDGAGKTDEGGATRASDLGHALSIGRTTRNVAPTYPFLGDLDDVAIYRRALTPAEILAIYDCD